MDINKKMMGPSKYKSALKWMIAFAILVFLGRMVWGNWSQVEDTRFTLQPFPFILSTLIFAFSYFIQVWAWYLITRKLKVAVSFPETINSWFYSQLGKYLPGKIWLVLGRIYYYQSRGKSKKSVSVALYFEMVTVIIAGGIIFLSSLALLPEIRPFYSGKQPLWLIPIFIAAFASVHPKILEKIVNWALPLLGRERISFSVSYSDILWVLLICIIAWLIGGIGFHFFVASVYPAAPQYILFLTGALAISSTLGLIAIFAPSGLGVREGVLVYLLSLIMPTPAAVIISILTRIWMTLIEIGLIGVIYLVDKFKEQQKRKKNGTA